MINGDDELIQAYVEESRDHLADIENNLLTIEKMGANLDENLINKVFRAAHSIKGSAGFLGLCNIKELSHKIENVLGMIRNHEMIPDPEIINVLLHAFDQLKKLINNIDQSDQIDISAHVVSLTHLTNILLPSENKEILSNRVNICLPDGNVVFCLSEFDLSQSKKGARNLYLVEYDLIHDVQKKGKTPLTILSDIQDIGIILESKVDIARVGTLEDETLPNKIPFIILFATIIEPDHITTLFEIDTDKIQHVAEDMIIKSLPKDEACQSEKPTGQTDLAPENKKPDPTFEACEQKLKIGDEHLQASNKETSLRVNVGLLDSLMVMAGELVLSRNQLLQAISSGDQQASKTVGQRIDLITTELQEAIMMTRMQSIENIFNKFPRLVRDLSKDLGKEIEVILEGKEVELDKTIIEGLSDPLTHLVRNAIDHGIEVPDARQKAGKKINGKIFLRAYHEAGQVNIEISDDGKGIDGDYLASKAVLKGLISKEQSVVMSDRERINLIFLPGFSTVENVTEISGRGVGMDVVKNNLDRLGGQIEIDSKPGQGTKIRIKLPLTLAIIPSLLVTVAEEIFAIPQMNVDELLRIPYARVKDRIEIVGNTAVVRLREELLPLIRPADVLGIDYRYIDPAGPIKKPNRRHNIADRRSRKSPLIKPQSLSITEFSKPSNQSERRTQIERRNQLNSALNIVIVSTGVFKYGLVVDAFHDSEEIVVKPLGRHLKNCKGYAGATILGDGHVALILDVTRFAQMAGLTSLSGTDRAVEVAGDRGDQNIHEIQPLLTFRNAATEHFAVPLNLVQRVEKVKSSDIERIGEKKVIQYRDASLPVMAIEEVAEVSPMVTGEDVLIIVFCVTGRQVGLLASPPIDIVEVPLIIDDTTLKQTGIMGSIIVGNHTTLFIDIFEIVKKLYPAWFDRSNQNHVQLTGEKNPTILLAEDSDFFRNQLKDIIVNHRYDIVEAQDGAIAWDLLQKHAEDICCVVTDIEMPNMDGFALAEKIKKDQRFSDLPIIAVTTLAGDDDIAKGKAMGIDDYQIKLDKENLIQSISKHVKSRIIK